ncbi:hypothetical protein K503DRAFT_589082 [Rhizopogon vinicolor AM-OR11-026]|uniref:DUF6533 domain-containing protein n=1 Tax=Rhizopogon vinicolor AM-OR11-026 TaxID=1314800 RepID=A0A1B7N765_9AGAM|nr:hypothetical protein K503DRAFT_589082 [Rhizopogon vinicolor AM-OR11-026]
MLLFAVFMATQAVDVSSAAISQLQYRVVNYVFIVVVTSVVYDFLTNLDDELDYLLNSRTTLAKVLFIACRYIPFVLCALHVPMAFGVIGEACPWIAQSIIVSCVTLMSCAECIFALRTYALWNFNRRVRMVLLISFLALLCGVATLVVACGVTMTKTTFTAGCYAGPVPTNFILAPYILLLLLEIEIVCLTFYRMMKYYYTTRCRLLTLVTQYSIGYIFAGLFVTVLNIIAIAFLPEYGLILEVVQIIGQALLATRMQLALWLLPVALNPTSESNEHGLTNLEVFELSQRSTSFAPSGTV